MNSLEARMTKTRKIDVAILSMASVVLVAATWTLMTPRASHEIVIPAVHGAQR
jgi:hypothetical protein